MTSSGETLAHEVERRSGQVDLGEYSVESILNAYAFACEQAKLTRGRPLSGGPDWQVVVTDDFEDRLIGGDTLSKERLAELFEAALDSDNYWHHVLAARRLNTIAEAYPDTALGMFKRVFTHADRTIREQGTQSFCASVGVFAVHAQAPEERQLLAEVLQLAGKTLERQSDADHSRYITS
ncbi:MAG TPA: hypothetical protein VIF43_00915 [Patescibacteria group bacterium]|jgi:hypothetical protein